ncbi:MAG: T9SS type A sorting domain-containing protein [bacterium]
MRRLLVALVATFLVLATKLAAEADDIVYIPDPYFKNFLVNMYYEGYQPVDLNKDGEIQYSEAAAYTEWLRISGESTDSITDLTGIKEFINIKKLLMERNVLINEIDVSGMVNLEQIDFFDDWNLEVLNASGCKNLLTIKCNDSKIKLLNAENCSKINRINCLNNPMEEINLKGCSNLQTIISTKGNLKELNITDCTKLDGIICSFNKLTELDLSNLKYFTGLTCDNNQLKKIDLSNSPSFVRLVANDNQLEAVNVRNGNNKSITKFKIYGNSNLKCITVDDPTYSKENWKDIDEWTKFSEDCSNSINENQSNSFKVFPNPANNTVLIERISPEEADLRVIDITGRICLIHPIQYGETQIQLDITMLSAGKYVIEINKETNSLIVE